MNCADYARTDLRETGKTAPKPLTTRPDAGFSLLELMVAVIILSILALTIIPRVIDRPDQARVARARSDVAALEQAVRLYRLDNFAYPTSEQGLLALVEKPRTGPEPKNYPSGGYLDRLPSDPWGADYQYLQPGVHGEIDIFTFGADGASGGTGTAADIGTWNLE
jgi:general secretion pathway protein G